MQALDVVVSAFVCSCKYCLVLACGTTSFYLPELYFVGLFVCVFLFLLSLTLPWLFECAQMIPSVKIIIPICLSTGSNSHVHLRLGIVHQLWREPTGWLSQCLYSSFSVSDGFCDCRYFELVLSSLVHTALRICPIHVYFSVTCQKVLHKWSLNKYLWKEVAVARNGGKLRWKSLQDISVVVWEKIVKDLISLLTTLGFIL